MGLGQDLGPGLVASGAPGSAGVEALSRGAGATDRAGQVPHRWQHGQVHADSYSSQEKGELGSSPHLTPLKLLVLSVVLARFGCSGRVWQSHSSSAQLGPCLALMPPWADRRGGGEGAPARGMSFWCISYILIAAVWLQGRTGRGAERQPWLLFHALNFWAPLSFLPLALFCSDTATHRLTPTHSCFLVLSCHGSPPRAWRFS